eukprot:12931113-Prorocentrum_lima.AAC.1
MGGSLPTVCRLVDTALTSRSKRAGGIVLTTRVAAATPPNIDPFAERVPLSLFIVDVLKLRWRTKSNSEE